MKKQRPEKNNEDLPEAFIVTDVLDLHGFFPEQIPEVMEEFIRNARSLGLTHLTVIHGKGKSKLKYLVRKHLASHFDVADFGDAPPESGGWGRTLVRLRES